jgi:uncharacterized protein
VLPSVNISNNLEGIPVKIAWLLPVVLCVSPTLRPAALPQVVEAAKNLDKAALRSLIEAKADVNAPCADGTTALDWAVRADDAEAVNLLLRAGAKPDVADRYAITPLSLAIQNEDQKVIGALLEAGASVNFAGEGGETPLMTAARTGNTETMKALLERGAEVNARDRQTGQTALMWAVRGAHPAAVELLLAHGAEVNVQTEVGPTPPRRAPNAGGGSHGLGINRGGTPPRGTLDPTPGGFTALHYAARDGHLEIAKMLVAAHADVNLVEANGIHSLLAAISNDHVDLAQFLLDHGSDANSMDVWGRTPLFEAVAVRNLEVNKTDDNGVDREAMLGLIQSLLDHGAKPNERTLEQLPTRRWIMFVNDISWVDFSGQTPFLRAALSGDISVMRLLLKYGANQNIPTYEGTTALMAAAGVNWAETQTYTESKEHLLEAVKLCLELGADVNASNSMGLTAALGAINRGSNDILTYLVEHGARLDVKDKEGRTAMNWAEGVFLATVPPERKPETIALLERLMAGKAQ